MSVLELKLLGWPEVHHRGEPIKFRSQKALALLAYLAVEGGMRSRSELVALLWPESNESKGRVSLRQTLTYLKHPLADREGPDETPHLLVERNAVGCNFTSDIETDFARVETAYSAAQELSYSHDWGGERLESLTRLTTAVENYRGDFLQGLAINGSPAFDYWLEVERESWRRRLDLIFDQLSSLRLKESAFSEALVTAESWVKHSRLNESAYRRLMEARSMLGDRTGALEVYRSCKEILESEAGVEPSPDTQNLAARLRDSDLKQSSSFPTRPEPSPGESVPDVSLVGRSGEFARLAAAYHQACSQKPKVVAVSGEAGIGKTCLAEKFLFWAKTQGADVIRGRAFGTEGTPYGTVVDLTRQRLEKERAPDDLLPDIWLSELSRLLPELLDRYPDLPPAASSETTARTGFLEALVQSIRAFSKLAPVVVVVDDLHRVDQDSLDTILYITQRSAELGLRILLLVCLRPGEPAANISVDNWLSSLGLPVERIRLGPLNEQETRQFLQAVVSVDYGANTAGEAAESPPIPEWFGQWLFEETGGHPFFLVETINELFEQNLLTLSKTADNGQVVELKARGADSLAEILPRGVSELIRERLDQLSAGAHELLVTGSVLGRDFSFEDLCNVSGTGEVECLARLEEALSARILEESSGGTNQASAGIYSFTHDKIRAVVYATAGSARRKLFHRRAFELLKDSTTPPATLTHHATASEIPHEAFRYNVQTGNEAIESLEVNKATAYYQRAYKMLDDDTLREKIRSLLPASEIGDLYLRTGKTAEFGTEWEKSREIYGEMLRYAKEEKEPEIQRKALISLAGLALRWELDPNGAQDLLSEAKRLSGNNESVSSIETNWNLLVVCILKWNPRKALRLGKQALDSSRRMGLPESAAFSLYMLANAHLFNGDWESAAARASEAAAEAEKLHTELDAAGKDPVTPVTPLPGILDGLPSSHRARVVSGQSLGIVAIAEIHSGRPYKAVASVREALSGSLETRSPETISLNLAELSLALLEVGDLGEALHAAEQSLTRGRSISPLQLTPRLASLGAAQFFTGQLEEARDAFREILEFSDDRPYPTMVSILSMLCASCAEIGDLQAAREYAVRVVSMRQRAPEHLFLADFTSYYETAVLLNSGDEALAREGVLRLGGCVGKDLRYRIPYLVSSALLSRWEGYTGEAIKRLEEALQLAGEINLPLQSWRLETLLGDFCEELGKSEQAEQARLRSDNIQEELSNTIQDETLRTCFLNKKRILENILQKGSKETRWKPAVRRYDENMAQWIPARQRRGDDQA